MSDRQGSSSQESEAGEGKGKERMGRVNGGSSRRGEGEEKREELVSFYNSQTATENGKSVSCPMLSGSVHDCRTAWFPNLRVQHSVLKNKLASAGILMGIPESRKWVLELPIPEVSAPFVLDMVPFT